MSAMDKVLRGIAGLLGLLFLVMGVRWIIAPEGIANELGMPLLEGLALSTQIGDLASFFVTLGLSALIGVITLQRTWFYPAIMLLVGAALFRTLAWALHDAAFATQAISVEVVSAVILLVAALRLTKA